MPYALYAWHVKPPATFRNGARLLGQGPTIRADIPDADAFRAAATAMARDTRLARKAYSPAPPFLPNEVILGLFDYSAKDYVHTATLAELVQQSGL